TVPHSPALIAAKSSGIAAAVTGVVRSRIAASMNIIAVFVTASPTCFYLRQEAYLCFDLPPPPEVFAVIPLKLYR
ncbi:hypothetical protein KAJ77_09300, partial [bacterium]|nr:hypothetical protein [bacterium]